MNIDDLFKAAHGNDAEGVRRAVTEGTDVNQPHPRAGTFALQLAKTTHSMPSPRCSRAAQIPRLTLTRTSRVDGRVFENETCLLHALSPQAAKLLLDAGADIDAADGRDWTAIMCAAARRAEHRRSFHAPGRSCRDPRGTRPARLECFPDPRQTAFRSSAKNAPSHWSFVSAPEPHQHALADAEIAAVQL
jgi:hypothetical protein